MSSLTHAYPSRPLRPTLARQIDEYIEKLIPRRCMVISASLILLGLGIPFLMVIHLLPVHLLLGFVGFALAATGGVLMLTLYGEI